MMGYWKKRSFNIEKCKLYFIGKKSNDKQTDKTKPHKSMHQ